MAYVQDKQLTWTARKASARRGIVAHYVLYASIEIPQARRDRIGCCDTGRAYTGADRMSYLESLAFLGFITEPGSPGHCTFGV